MARVQTPAADILQIRPLRWGGVGHNSQNPLCGPDAPAPWKLQDNQFRDALSWDMRLNRVAKRPTQFGGNLPHGAGIGDVRGFLHATGQGYSKPLICNSYGEVIHYSAAAWGLVTTVANPSLAAFAQMANGLGVTLIPLGGTSALQEYNGTTVAAVGGSAPIGLINVLYFRLSQRFLGFKANEDSLRWCNFNDRTNWSTGDSGTEPIGNDRKPLVALADGPGDMVTIFKGDSAFLIERTNPDNWSFRRIGQAQGILGAAAWCPGPAGSLFFAYNSGIWGINSVGTVLPMALTAPIENIWKKLVNDNASGLPFVSLAYHPVNEELYVTFPGSSGATRLFRCYVPDGSWCLEETVLTGPPYYGPLAMLEINSVKEVYYPKYDDTANTGQVWQLNATGSRSGTSINTKLYGEPSLQKLWGQHPAIPGHLRKALVYVRGRGGGTVRITPTVWRDDGTSTTGTVVDKVLSATSGNPVVVEVPLPESVAVFISFKLENITQDDVFDVDGIDCPYEIVGYGVRVA